MKTAFIFDFDGTLGETIPLALKAMQKAFDYSNLTPPSVEELVSKFGPSELGLFQIFNKEKSDELFKQYLRAYSELQIELDNKPFDGIEGILIRLKNAGAHLGLVTGKSYESAIISLDHYGFTKYFSQIETGDVSGTVKPQRILKELDFWKIPPSNAFYIGDAVQDVLDTRQAGVKMLAAAWSGLVSDANQLAALKPHKLFKSIPEFSNWLNSFYNS